MRADGRRPEQLRDIQIERRFTDSSPGSVLIRAGRTMVLCTATLEDGVPPFLMNTNQGWLTAEYSMLPGSTGTRKAREGRTARTDSRSLEISRLIGRAMRAAIHLGRVPGRTIWIDCDVLQADGGTRTLAVSGAMVALRDAVAEARRRGWVRGDKSPFLSPVAAVSAGVVEGEVLLDLDYSEDSRAEVDANVVMNGRGELVELSCSAERRALTRAELDRLLELCQSGIQEILSLQEKALSASAGP